MRGFGRGRMEGHGRRGRGFGHGGLRLVLLQLIAEKPRHGYELIKAIEEQLGGAYSPSPGVVYPTLTMLEELGYATVTPTEDGRKLYAATAAGLAWLEEQRPELEAVMSRLRREERHERPPQVVRAVENLRLALHLRLERGPLTPEQADAIADLLDSTARSLERI